MGCKSCKGNKSNKAVEGLGVLLKDDDKTLKFGVLSIVVYFIRFVMFIFSIVCTPAIILFTWYMLFKTIMLNNSEINLMPFLVKVARVLGVGRSRKNDKTGDDIVLDVDKSELYEFAEKVDKIEL